MKLDWEKWGYSAGINAKSVAFQGAESAASGKVMLWLLRSFQGINDTRSEDRNGATLLDFCARPDPVQHFDLEVSTCACWQIDSLMKSIVFLSISASSSFSLGEICAKVRFSTPAPNLPQLNMWSVSSLTMSHFYGGRKMYSKAPTILSD